MPPVLLFHDGCRICLGIETLMTDVFPAPAHRFESIDLSRQQDRIAQARALGVERLPSLVIDGRVLRLDDHSDLAHV